MSGNSSRKYKRYKESLERRQYFGDLEARDSYGILQLTAYGASRGTAITSTVKYDKAKVPIQKQYRKCGEHPK